MTAVVTGKYAVYHVIRHWLVDTCTGGTWNETVEEATWFDTRDEATAALAAAEIPFDAMIVICRVR